MIRKHMVVPVLMGILFGCHEDTTLTRRYQQQGYQTFEAHGIALKCPCYFEDDPEYRTRMQAAPGSTSLFLSCNTETEKFELIISDNTQADFTPEDLNFELKQLYNSENRVWKDARAADMSGVRVVYTNVVQSVQLNNDRSGLMLTVVSPDPEERLTGMIKSIRTY